ncbi:MAG: MBL fold metallo-hydrolase, partial [Deltaproteobacteria bacterium]
AQTVTGSCCIIEFNSSRFAIDCGMHQGNGEIEKRNWEYLPYEPERLDFIVITHAHIDHSGLLPLMVKHGFRGKIYATPPTVDLLKIMLADAAHIQEIEAFWKSKKFMRRGGKPIEPLYNDADVQHTLPMLEKISYAMPFTPCTGLDIVLRDAGHILGSAFVEITTHADKIKTVFSGDIGRPRQFIINDPSLITNADYLIMESTYGDRNHRDETKSLDELAEAIGYSYNNGGKVIIPAFALERTQEIIYALRILSQKGQLPKDMPVYLDSPLAVRATEIFKQYRSYFDEEAKELYQSDIDPLTLSNLRYSLTAQESMSINEITTPAVIISASGMANAGRIKHHLRHNLWRENSAIVFVGFQAQGTTGRKIVDGEQKVRIFNEEVAVKAKIFTINGFSAHADQSQLLTWLGNFQSPRMQIFLVHGEANAQEKFKQAIMQKFNFNVRIPKYREEIALNSASGCIVKEGIELTTKWDETLKELSSALDNLEANKENLSAQSLFTQDELRERIKDINDIVRVISKK